MEFASYEEYVEYVENDISKYIEILKKTHIFNKELLFQLKVVLYKRLSDSKYLVYKAVQYGNHAPFKKYEEFDYYWDAYNKYKEFGGN